MVVITEWLSISSGQYLNKQREAHQGWVIKIPISNVIGEKLNIKEKYAIKKVNVTSFYTII